VTAREEFAVFVREAFERLGPDHPAAVLLEAAASYRSTGAHEARARAAATAYALEFLDGEISVPLPRLNYSSDGLKSARCQSCGSETIAIETDGSRADLVECLDLAIATVELHTPNGAQSAPAWPKDATDSVDYQAVASQGRALLAALEARK
jgi:hypothetical protein